MGAGLSFETQGERSVKKMMKENLKKRCSVTVS